MLVTRKSRIKPNCQDIGEKNPEDQCVHVTATFLSSCVFVLEQLPCGSKNIESVTFSAVCFSDIYNM